MTGTVTGMVRTDCRENRFGCVVVNPEVTPNLNQSCEVGFLEVFRGLTGGEAR
jgi:hypothetical protein